MMDKFFLVHFFLFLNLSYFSFASVSLDIPKPYIQDSKKEPILSEKKVPKLGVIEFILQNGLRVVLKPTNFEKDEIYVKMCAKGGYASLCNSQRASGELAAEVAWESGISNLTSDQISVLLYEYSIEFSPKIQPYTHSIEGVCNEDGLESLLQLIHLVFTKPRFSKEAFDKVQSQASENICKKMREVEESCNGTYRGINAECLNLIKPLTLQEIKKADYQTSKEFFQYLFSNPSDFTLVVVGSFNMDLILSLIKRYLAILPIKNHSVDTTQLMFYPEAGKSDKSLEKFSKITLLQNNQKTFTRILIPLKINLDENKIDLLEITRQIIEERLRKSLKYNKNFIQEIDVSYQFSSSILEPPLMTIELHCQPHCINTVTQTILIILKQLQTQGPTHIEMTEAKKKQKQRNELWLQDNYFWLSELSNAYLWGWNPHHILSMTSENDMFTYEDIQLFIQQVIPKEID